MRNSKKLFEDEIILQYSSLKLRAENATNSYDG